MNEVDKKNPTKASRTKRRESSHEDDLSVEYSIIFVNEYLLLPTESTK